LHTAVVDGAKNAVVVGVVVVVAVFVVAVVVVVVVVVAVVVVGFNVVIHVVAVESSKLWRAAIKTSKHNVLITQNSGQTGAPMSSDSHRHTVSQTVQLAMNISSE
jgi:uncharacterized membrane protein